MKFGWPTSGSPPSSGRWLSSRDTTRALVVYVPITSQDRGSPYEVALPKTRFLQAGSVANVQGIGSLPIARLDRRIGVLRGEMLGEIKNGLAWALELGPSASSA